ncbi:helix-turn-helix transcriptional regulator [bacterium]|nr:helix-turn-helix transcriptional regulator [bacterium]
MLQYIDHFPDPRYHRFDKSEWMDRHGKANVIIHSESNAISFPKHWGPLSLKTTIKGNEYYVTDPGKFKVGPENFLILNEDTHYSSFIPDGSKTESLTFNFGSVFLNSFNMLWEKDEIKLMDDPFICEVHRIKFPEHLHKHQALIYKHLRKISRLLSNFKLNAGRIEEEMSFLYEGLFRFSAWSSSRVDKIHAKRRVTREEIYRRIHVARDYMDACYDEDVSLEKLSEVSCLSQHHFLRQFKSFFKLTPRQYLIKRRMEEARNLLAHSDLKVTEVWPACRF